VSALAAVTKAQRNQTGPWRVIGPCTETSPLW